MNYGKYVLVASLLLTLGPLTSISRAADSNGPGPFNLSNRVPQDLGTLGGTISIANSVDAFTANVAGNANTLDDAATHAVIWNVKSKKIEDLGVLSGGTNSYGAGVTFDGTATGYSDYSDPVYGLVSRAFLFQNSTLSMLGTLGGSQSFATGINECKQVVGYSFTVNDAATHAFIYNSKTQFFTDLGTLGGTNSSAYAINDLGLVAGSADTANVDSFGNPITDAVIWDTFKKKSYDLGTLGGNYAQLSAISNFGIGAGYSYIASGNLDAAAYINGKLVDLGTLGGSAAQASGINDFGYVVGFSNTIGDAAVHAFLWSPSTGLLDLNSFLPANSPWLLIQATGINDEGRIVGYGLINGESHAFIW